jgi:hypothetical protein
VEFPQFTKLQGCTTSLAFYGFLTPVFCNLALQAAFGANYYSIGYHVNTSLFAIAAFPFLKIPDNTQKINPSETVPVNICEI